MNKRIKKLLEIESANNVQELLGTLHLPEILKDREWRGEVRLEGPLPRYLWVEVGSFWREKGWRLITCWDITEMKLKEEARRVEDRLLSFSHLAAGMAHEIGNPLNALQIHLQLLEKNIGEDEGKVRKHLEIVKEELKRLTSMVEEFLSAIRPVQLKREERYIQDIIKGVVEVYSPEFERRGIHVDMDLSPVLPPTLVDEARLRQAFLNVIKNAVESMPEGGKLKITARLERGKIYVDFEDEGTGIPSSDLKRIFEPFFTTKEKGIGLGLFITNKIIRAHGGEIKVESKVGEGSKFTVVIPVERKKVPLPVLKEGS